MLEQAVRPQEPRAEHVFFCGIAMNQRDMLDLFETVFLLSLDHETQVARLNAASNAHRNAAMRAQITEGRPVFEQETRAAGAVVLDGRRPTAALARQILQIASSRPRC